MTDPLPASGRAPEQQAWSWPADAATGGGDGGGAPVPPPETTRRGRRALVAAALVAGSAVLGGVLQHQVSPSLSAVSPGPGSGTVGGQAALGPDWSATDATAPSTAPGGLDVAGVAARVNPALVDINVTLSYQHAQAAGTGIVLTATGEVLTNNHVIAGATALSVTDVGNGRTYDATVVGYDVAHDLAVLQLRNASGLRTADIGDSSRVVAGQPVVALGNAGGRGGVPSSAGGTITALDQSITASSDSTGASEQLSGLIQISANIQPGDSGGPLVNQSGQVIGINTAASSGYSFRNAGTEGFAIPTNAAQVTVRQIEAGRGGGTVHVGATPFLGVLISTGGQAGDPSAGTPAGPGATLGGVVPGGPAEQLGLTGGDVITSLAGQVVDSPAALSKLVAQQHPGNTIRLGWTDAAGAAQLGMITVASGPPA